MAQLEVFEGTWEELAAHAEALKGRKLRLIVLPSEAETTGTLPDETGLRARAERLFGEADALLRASGKLGSDPQAAAFSQIIAEKYRKMGLLL